MITRFTLCAILVFALSACGLIHKQDIQQGNILDEDDVAQLELGMTQRQVMVLLGSPSVQSQFHDHRWDYVNTFSRRGGKPVKRVLTLRFDDQRLASVEGTYLDQESAAAQALRELQRLEAPPIQDLESIQQDP